jgi:hypothetical protein
MDRRGPWSYLRGMRLAALLLLWPVIAAPALAQTCDASGEAGEVFEAVVQGKPAVGWDVKRSENVGEESDHFARPRLALTFAIDRGKLSGPLAASVHVSTYSDSDVGAAPSLNTMRMRAKADDRAAVEWGVDWAAGEATLAAGLRAQWPRALVIDVIGPDGAVASSGVFDLSARSGAETLALGLPASCFQ